MYYLFPDGTSGTSWIMAFDEAGGWADRGAGVWPSVHAPMENTLASMVVPTGFVGLNNDLPGRSSDLVIEIDPNPLTQNTSCRIVPVQVCHLTFRRLDINGRAVFLSDLGMASKAGTTLVLIRESLSPGLYICIAGNGTIQVTSKLVVQQGR